MRALHRPRQPLFPHPQGRRAGLEEAGDASRAGFGAARHPPYRGLFARGARPFRARFRTLQDRLPKELALAGITTIAAANRFIAERYLPQHNAAFAIAPAEAGSAFVPDRAGAARAILCIQEEHRVGNDNTIKWGGLALQIPPSPLRPHFVRATVRVHEYRRLAIVLGPHRLAAYDPEGRLCDDAKMAA